MTSNELAPTLEKSQFSLRALLIGIAGVAVTLGVSRWNLAVGVAVGLALLGSLAIFTGMRRRSPTAKVLGSVLIFCSLAWVVIRSATVVMWVGSHKLDVHVVVLEASTLQPIPSATIELFDGPHAFEGSIRIESELTLISQPVSLITNDRGQVQFVHAFFAAGSDGLFETSGYVRTNGVWLRVTAPGYATTYLPIDQQSGRGRSITDDSTILVTVPVAKE